MRRRIVCLLPLLAGLTLLACSRSGSQASGQQNPSSGRPAPSQADSAPSASVQAKPKTPPRPVGKIPSPEEVAIRGAGKFTIHASYWKASEPHAPALVMAHSLGADRHEWDQVLRRLVPSHLSLNMISVDLRGHGKSTGQKGKQQWVSMSEAQFAKLPDDMLAVMHWLEKQPGGPPSAFVLAGSDIGGTALVIAARQWSREQAKDPRPNKSPKGKDAAKPSSHRPCLAGLVLVSPGAKLRGLDIYHPFATFTELPVLLVASSQDTISSEPMLYLGRMGHHTEKMSLGGVKFHGLRFVDDAHADVWDRVSGWIEKRVRVGCGKSPDQSSR